ncbi:hypothetical protein [Blautia sp. MSJ-9]|uniref:hypothetical protein n=1 Tax=Blautia sp. MSJ-9 TaxID=2841511 RepID=UPI001C112D02|nr:hypothetical protein [Blautia sp. MSJ-9]MBU5679382.1 hypothetical protein [Blautia sp. MSJ-9]
MKKRTAVSVILAATMMVSTGIPAMGAEFTSGEQAEASAEFTDQSEEEQIAGFSENAEEVPVAQSYEDDDEDNENAVPESISIVKEPKRSNVWYRLEDYPDEGLDFWGMCFEITYTNGEKSQVEIDWESNAYVARDEYYNVYDICLLDKSGQRVTGEVQPGDYECVIRYKDIQSNSIPIQVLHPDQATELKQDISNPCTTEVKVIGNKAVVKFIPQYDTPCRITSPDDVSINVSDADFNNDTSEKFEKGKTYYIWTYNTSLKKVNFKLEYESEITSVKLIKEPEIKYTYEGTARYYEMYLRGGKIEVTYANGTTQVLPTDYWCRTKTGKELIAKCDYEGSYDMWRYDPVPVGTYDVYFTIKDTEQKVCVKNVEVKPLTSMPTINGSGTVTVDNIGRNEAWLRLKTGNSEEYVIEALDKVKYLDVYKYDAETKNMEECGGNESGETFRLNPNTEYYIRPESATSEKITFKVTELGVQDTVKMPNCSISMPNKYTYKGKAVVPKVKITYKGKELVKDKDYTISCKSNTKIGTASVTITGKGNYTGSVKKTYQITLGTPTVTSAKTSGKDAVKLTWKKAAGATKYLVYRYDGKTWKKAGTTASITFTDRKLKKGMTYKYKVRAVCQNNGKNVYSSYSVVKSVKR